MEYKNNIIITFIIINTININTNDLSVEINIDLDYLGYSYNKFNIINMDMVQYIYYHLCHIIVNKLKKVKLTNKNYYKIKLYQNLRIHQNQ